MLGHGVHRLAWAGLNEPARQSAKEHMRSRGRAQVRPRPSRTKRRQRFDGRTQARDTRRAVGASRAGCVDESRGRTGTTQSRGESLPSDVAGETLQRTSADERGARAGRRVAGGARACGRAGGAGAARGAGRAVGGARRQAVRVGRAHYGRFATDMCVKEAADPFGHTSWSTWRLFTYLCTRGWRRSRCRRSQRCRRRSPSRQRLCCWTGTGCRSSPARR